MGSRCSVYEIRASKSVTPNLPLKRKRYIKTLPRNNILIYYNVKLVGVYLLDICALGEHGVPIAARLQEVGRCEAI